MRDGRRAGADGPRGAGAADVDRLRRRRRPARPRQCLVQELPAIEGLARVDVVCVDKTGTLTESACGWPSVAPVERRRTVRATRSARWPPPTRAPTPACWPSPRPSRRPPAGRPHGDGAVLVGPQVERRRLRRARDLVPRRTRRAARPGSDPGRAQSRGVRRRRDCACCCSAAATSPVDDAAAPGAVDARRARGARAAGPARAPPTPSTTSPRQGVAVKVISGDNARAVGAVAGSLGLPGADDPVDARAAARRPRAARRPLETHTVFGRVTPAAEAGDGGRAAVTRSHGGDDRRRRQRRARAQGRRHRRVDGLGQPGHARGGAVRAARQLVRDAARPWSPRAAG